MVYLEAYCTREFLLRNDFAKICPISITGILMITRTATVTRRMARLKHRILPLNEAVMSLRIWRMKTGR